MTKSNWNTLLLGVVLACFSACNASAQCYGCCQDSTLRQPNAACGLDYVPVCGCNGKTYRNDCYATVRDAIASYTAGPCDPMDFIIYPIPVAISSNFGLTLTIAVKTSIDVQVYIMDVYGHQYFYRTLGYMDQNLPPYSYQVPIDNLKTGVYIIIVKTGLGYFKIKRFVVADI